MKKGAQKQLNSCSMRANVKLVGSIISGNSLLASKMEHVTF